MATPRFLPSPLILGKGLERGKALEQQAVKLDEVWGGLEWTWLFHRVALQHVSGLVVVCRKRRLPEIEVVAQGMSPLKIFPMREVTPSRARVLARSSSEDQLCAPHSNRPLAAEYGGVAIWSVRPPRPRGPTT